MRIDAHQHFWTYHPVKHSWISDEMSSIRKDFGPKDLESLLVETNQVGCIAVQADETEQETVYLLEIANQHPSVKGVVGWTDLKSDQVEERLEYWKMHKKIVGFRCIMQGQPDDAYLKNKSFISNVKKLATYNYTYDLLVYHDQLPSLLRFTDQLPDNPMILDHIAKPDIRNRNFKTWSEHIKSLSANPNIYCKLSGMITEADYRNWTYEQIKPYMETVAEHFGTDRICFGSDWPVCLVAGTYQQVYQLVETFALQLSQQEKDNLFGLNTARFYNI